MIHLKQVIIISVLILSPLTASAQNWYQQRIEQLERENRELKTRLQKLESQVNPDGFSSLDTDLGILWDNLTGIDETDEPETGPSRVGGIEEKVYASAFQKRLAAIDTVLCVPYVDKIEAYVKIYTQKRAKSTLNAIRRYERYHPLFSAMFSKYGVPDELTALCILESAVSTKALSPVGALGMWQIMPATGRGHGLNVDEVFLNDDRCDPVKSTEVAAKVMRNLYSRLGDWRLVILAYNCGEGNLRKAIIRSGGNADFWTLVSYLPKETQNYIPAFLAILYAVNYQELIG